jgi:hypothetical protein
MSIGDAANCAIALFTFIGLIYVVIQVSDSRKQAYGQFLFELDTQFRAYEKLHQQLMSVDGADYEPSHDEMIEVWRYVGLFERCKILLDNNTISMETFEAFYGYRLYSVVGNCAIRKSIKLSYRKYQYFIRLCNDVVKFKKRYKTIQEEDDCFAKQIECFELQEPRDWRDTY